MKSDPLAAHRKVESLTGEGFLRRELALALRVSSREEETRRKKKKKTGNPGAGVTASRRALLSVFLPRREMADTCFRLPRAPRARSATEAVAWTSCWG